MVHKNIESYKMMKLGYMTRIFVSALLCAVALASCVKENEPSGDEMESRALRAWIKKHHPELLVNHQAKGDYYIDIVAWGEETDMGTENDYGDKPVMEQDSVWMFYNVTGYDLDGNVCLNRNEAVARMQGTFKLATHYIPYLNFSGEVNAIGLLESTYLLARNEVTLGDKYVADHSDVCKDKVFKLRRGSKVRIYAPSSITYASSGVDMDGGFGGQFALDGNVPMILDIEVLRTIKNPSDLEIDMITAIVGAPDNKSDGQNGWTLALTTGTTAEEGVSDDKNDDGGEENSEDKKKLIGLYYNLQFDPGKNDLGIRYLQPHVTDMSVSHPYKDSGKYADMAALDKQINDILAAKFKDKVRDKADMSEETLVTKSGTANTWYVMRFLDGFVVDSNIREINELMFEKSGSTTVNSYTPDGTGESMINAWLYCVPKLHYGQWAAILTPSGFAYGANGTTTTSSSSSTVAAMPAMPYYDYYNYNSMYYGSGYYYGGYYGGYNPYLMPTTTTETSLDTEILGYTPLLFYVFIEPKAE